MKTHHYASENITFATDWKTGQTNQDLRWSFLPGKLARLLLQIS